MSLVNYLGTYETLDQVWETYPEGGKEGDYLYIASVLKKWNKYTSAWVDATQEDVEGSTIMSLEEDVVVGSSTLINYLGRFETLENAINAYPEGGNEGDYIYVGDDIYAWDKYANGWFVSSDTPLEFAISEEDIIPDSNTFINYLGGFVDRDAVWHKYPEGGKVGDYLYIASDLHIWDKYICNWVAATPPDESSQIRPIEHLSQEGVVEYSENYINYLGVFESIEQAWEAYPEGGKEGDYIIVDGEQLRWNKYTNNWGEYDPDASTPARPVATIYGDLHVHNDVIIGEDLYARILETFTTKKWVLEQGYISMDDVTSELVMSKIVPDNTTIEVRDGKLVVIGGGGGGTADSVEWDNITGKPEWIGNTKPTYTLDEIAGSNGDGFVTLLSDQTIEGVKNFANGAKFNGALLSYDEEKKAWVFPGNIIASGGITAFGSLSTPVASLFEALPIDGITIKRNPVTNELYVDTNVVGGSGGGGLDEEQLEEYLKPYAKTADVANTYATKLSVNAISTQLNDFLSGSDTDTIINKWSELETFLAGLAETDDLATILSGKANKATTLAGYGITDAYTKSHIDSNFVAIGTKQQITGEKDFVGGFKVNGGLVEYNATLKAWVFNGDLLVTGGVSAFSNIGGFTPSTITDAVLIDNVTIKRNSVGALYVASGSDDGGIDEAYLAEYLTANNYAKKSDINSALTDYATQSWVTGKGYITSSALEPYALKTTIPTKLSQLTDDVFSGKVLELEVAKIGYGKANSFPLELFSTNSYTGIAFRCSDGTAHLRFMGGSKWGVTSAGWTATYDLLHSGNYSDYALPITGGTITGEVTISCAANTPLKINSNATDSGVYFNHNGISKTWVGFEASRGSVLYHSVGSHRLGINNDGVAFYDSNTLLHSGNYSDYALPKGGTASASWKLANARYLWGQLFDGTSNIGGQMSFNAGSFILAHNATDAWTDGNGLTHPWYGIDFRAGGSYKGYISHWGGISLVSGNDITLATDKNVIVSNGKFRINQSAFNNGLILNRTAANAGAGIMFQSNGSLLGQIGINGTKTFEVSDGTTIKASIEIPTGNLLATGGITAQNSSDERLKRNLRKFNASKVLMSLGGVYEYEYIDSEVQKNHIYEGTHYGLIYQHVKGTTLDIMCHEREDGMGALNYIHPKFISLIAGATMENISEVETLKREVRHLKAKVKQLENRA